MKKSGLLITFEGIDGCGKSIQVKELTKHLRQQGHEFIVLREPGGTKIAEKIRTILLEKSEEMVSPIAEFLLFSAARAQLTKQVIIPQLNQGKIVILDRFYDSSSAYQGYGRGIDLDFIDRVNRMATYGVEPDVTFFLDISLEEMAQRMKKSGGKLDRMEDQSRAFFEKVRKGYLELAKQNSERFHVLDGKRAINQISEEIWQIIKEKIAGVSR